MSDPDTNLSAHSHTVRLALAGPADMGKEAAMELFAAAVPEELRGELVPIPSGRDTLLGLDINAPGLVDGDTVTLRLSAASGKIHEDDTLDRLLTRTDGLLFFTGNEPDRTELALDECTSTLDRNDRSPDTLPAVFVHPPGMDEAAVDAIADGIGITRDELLEVNTESGSGLFDALARLAGFVLKTWQEGGDTSAATTTPSATGPNPVPPSRDIRSEDLQADNDTGDLYFPGDPSTTGTSTFDFSDVDTDKPRGLFGLFGRKKK